MTAAPLDLDTLEALDAKIKPSMSVEDRYDAVQAYSTSLRDAAPALFAMARRVQQDASRERTHAPDCHLWGPMHYDCLMREYEAARAEIARLREALEAAGPFLTAMCELAAFPSRIHDALAKVRAALTSARSDPSPITEPQAGPLPLAP